jgi:hypothetical protein
MYKYLNNSLTAHKIDSVKSSTTFTRKVSFGAAIRASKESDKKPARKMPTVKT